MNLEILMRNTIINFFKYKNNENILDPLYDMIMSYLGAISNDYRDDIIFDDIFPYHEFVDMTIDDMEIDKNKIAYSPNHYKDAIDWMQESGEYIDFEISKKTKNKNKIERYIVRVKDNLLEKLLKITNIKYKKNTNLEVEQEECKAEAWEEFEKQLDNQDNYSYHGVNKNDFF